MSLDLLDDHDGGPFGPEVPSEVLFTSKLLSASDATSIIPEPQLTALLRLCFDYVSSKKFNRLQYLSLKQCVLKNWKESQLMVQLNLDKTDFDRFFAGLLKITQAIGRNFTAYKSHSALEQLKTDVAKHSRLSPELSDLLFAQFVDPETKIPQFAIVNNWAATGNRLISLRWRIDVVISDRYLSKIMEPVVRFELVVSNGGIGKRKMHFECRMVQFHRLRFMTACLLKEIGYLETRINGVPVK